jgi:hypothetical protein
MVSAGQVASHDLVAFGDEVLDIQPYIRNATENGSHGPPDPLDAGRKPGWREWSTMSGAASSSITAVSGRTLRSK